MPVTPSVYVEHELEVAKWVGETGNGLPVDVSRYPGMTIQASGTGTVTVFGSNDGINYVAMHDTTTTGAAISLDATAFAIAGILENPIWIQPRVATGTATIVLIAKSGR